MTPTNEEVRLRLYAAHSGIDQKMAANFLEMFQHSRDTSDRLLTAYLALEAERTAGLVEALQRIAKATPGNTNSHTAESMASWCHAVASAALAAFQTSND